MTSHKSIQTMKPATAAKKLGVFLEATPAEFQEGVVSRDELGALQTDPPAWLLELRRVGPHPRPVVAAKLGISIAGLARGGITDPLTTEQIDALKAEQPEWLERERATQVEVRKETVRIKEKNREKENGTTATETTTKSAKGKGGNAKGKSAKRPGRPGPRG
jgi:hypothetical protein